MYSIIYPIPPNTNITPTICNAGAIIDIKSPKTNHYNQIVSIDFNECNISNSPIISGNNNKVSL